MTLSNFFGWWKVGQGLATNMALWSGVLKRTENHLLRNVARDEYHLLQRHRELLGHYARFHDPLAGLLSFLQGWYHGQDGAWLHKQRQDQREGLAKAMQQLATQLENSEHQQLMSPLLRKCAEELLRL